MGPLRALETSWCQGQVASRVKARVDPGPLRDPWSQPASSLGTLKDQGQDPWGQSGTLKGQGQGPSRPDGYPQGSKVRDPRCQLSILKGSRPFILEARDLWGQPGGYPQGSLRTEDHSRVLKAGTLEAGGFVGGPGGVGGRMAALLLLHKEQQQLLPSPWMWWASSHMRLQRSSAHTHYYTFTI